MVKLAFCWALPKRRRDAPFFSFVGPNFRDLVDLSVIENIRLKERLSLQLRADMFNCINFASGAGAVNFPAPRTWSLITAQPAADLGR